MFFRSIYRGSTLYINEIKEKKMDSRKFINQAKYDFTNRVQKYIGSLKMKEKRCLFYLVRTTQGLTSNTFFPKFGISAGQFATFQVLNEHSRKSTSDSKDPTKEPKRKRKSKKIQEQAPMECDDDNDDQDPKESQDHNDPNGPNGPNQSQEEIIVVKPVTEITPQTVTIAEPVKTRTKRIPKDSKDPKVSKVPRATRAAKPKLQESLHPFLTSSRTRRSATGVRPQYGE